MEISEEELLSLLKRAAVTGIDDGDADYIAESIAYDILDEFKKDKNSKNE